MHKGKACEQTGSRSDPFQTQKILFLLQWCDSNLPSGSFTQSYGLETYILEEKIFDQETFFRWLVSFIRHQLSYTDGLACRLAFEALERGEEERIWYYDRLITVQNLPREAREGSRRIGERMLRLASELEPSPLVQRYLARVKEKRSFAHPALVFAILSWQWGVAEDVAVVSYLSSTMISLVQNGVRAIPLGQTEGQRLFRNLQPVMREAYGRIVERSEDDLGVVAPGLELAQIRHEWADARQFMS